MLYRALELASRDHFLRLFVEEGSALTRIFRRMDKSGLPATFLRELEPLLPDGEEPPARTDALP